MRVDPQRSKFFLRRVDPIREGLLSMTANRSSLKEILFVKMTEEDGELLKGLSIHFVFYCTQPFIVIVLLA